MQPQRALQIIFLVALLGVGFSGFLTYKEFFLNTGPSCAAVGAAGTIFGYPPCVYGLGMYTLLVVIATLGLVGARKALHSKKA